MRKVIATDLDGTLFYPRKKIKMISKKNVDFLQKFIKSGGKVVIVSGRNLPYAFKVMEKIGYPLDVIGCNSAFIRANEQLIQTLYLPYPHIQDVLLELQEKFKCNYYMLMSEDESLVIAGKKLNWFKSIFYKMIYKAQGVYAEKYVISNDIFFNEMKKGKIYKMMLFFGLGKKAKDRACRANKYIREMYPEIEASWTGNFIELTAKKATKAEGLKTYCEYMKINADDVIVVGDSGNDISMFMAFKNSYCMSHAPDKIKKYANNELKTVADLEEIVFEKENNNE